jgi:hypothetical protein
VLVLAAHKRQRGGDLARDFTLSTADILGEADRNYNLGALRKLLASRGNTAALDAFAGVPFQFVRAYDAKGNDFWVLHARVNVPAYEHLRQLRDTQQGLFETIRQTLTDDCDISVGYIAAELAAKGSELNPSSTEALEHAITEMRDLMVGIGRRERSLKDDQTKQDYARLRKELLKYKAIAAPPALVSDCPDEWSARRMRS